MLAFAQENKCDVALLDIQMRSMSGVELAEKLKAMQPQLNIIFVTGYNQYTGDAMRLHASGYIEKPATEAKLRWELDDLRHPVDAAVRPVLTVRCFGSFTVLDRAGAPVHFGRVKARECFAYLVSRCGASCSITEIAGVLFEGSPYDRRRANYMQKIVTDMMNSLRSAGAEAAVEKAYNAIAVRTELLDCDYYRLRSGNTANQLYGEERLERVLSEAPGTPQALCTDVRSHIDAFVQGAEQSDDITMLCVTWNGAEE